MKRKNKILILIIIIIFLLFILLIQNSKKLDNQLQDDIIFFKSFNLGKKQKNQDNQEIINYNEIFNFNETNQNQKQQQNQNYTDEITKVDFDVSYKNTKLKAINLANTINKNTLVNEKIAPGTSGKFEIELKTNQKINYKIEFESKNEKPENLVFKIDGKDRKYRTLEELGQELKGEIKENKTIFINWEWEYESNSTQNKQDTKDGERLKQYVFTIYVIGYK